MLKVLIVDDEPIFRIGLRSSINWANFDCEIIGEAANGKEALAIIQSQKPHIILLDIKMPGMDGLELLKICCHNQKDQYFIVLSCFNEYNYVREAMKLGALDYLFKPLMEGPDIEKVISEAREKLGCSSQNTNFQLQQHAIQTTLKRIIENHAPEDIAYIYELIPQLSSSWFFTMAITLPDKSLDAEKAYAILNSCQALISGFFKSCTCHFIRNDRILYALLYTENHSADLLSSLNLKAFSKQLNDYMGTILWAGFDTLRQNSDEFPESFNNAYYAMESNYFRKQESNIPFAVLYTPVMAQNYNYYELFSEEAEKIKAATLNYDIETIRFILNDIVSSICKHGYFNKNDFCHLLTSLITDSMRIYRNRIILEKLLLSNYHLISDIYYQTSMEQALQLFIQVMHTLFAHINGNVEDFHSRILQDVLDYINLHYNEKLTLELISEKTHLSVNYFCKIFKEQTGDTFINYLNKVRIHASVNLLQTTLLKTYEIAEQVGFSDYHYFCKTFKKYTGLTPSQMRAPHTTH